MPMRPIDGPSTHRHRTAHHLVDAVGIRALAFESAGSGIVITDATHPDNPIIDINPAFSRITGHSRADALGHNCRMLQYGRTDPATVDVIRTGLAAGREVNVTILNQRRDGAPFWNDLRITPVHGDDDVPTHFVGIQTDVTVRKMAEFRNDFLARSSEWLGVARDDRQALVRAAGLAIPMVADLCQIALTDSDGRLEVVASALVDVDGLATDALMAAWAPRSGDGHGLAHVVRTGAAQLIHAVESAGNPSLARASDELHRLAGVRLFSCLAVPVMARGRVLGAVMMATTDRSNRRMDHADLQLTEDFAGRIALTIDNARLFRETEQAVRSRDQFLSIAAHELRTPVSSIKGYAQMILRADRKGSLSPDRMRRSLEIIDSATDRLTLLTSDLLDVSRIRLGHLPLRLGGLDLAERVASVIERHRESIGGHHQLDLDVAAGDYAVRVDPDRLEQVLTNLIENAIKYSPESDRVDLRLSATAERIELAVRDYGIGLPAGGEASIFEPFERATNALERNLPGLGLGLYICRGIIERHGGTIHAHSDGDGKGTTLTVTLPTAAHAPDALGGATPRVGY